jgi:hypothetical protein
MTETLFFDATSRSLHSLSERTDAQAAALEAVMQEDRDFFLQHPDRDWYLRSVTPIEVREARSMGNPVTDDAMVLVGEVAPGSRIRLTFWGDELPPVEEFKSIQQQIRQEWGVKSVGLKDRLKHAGKGRPKAKGIG